MTRYLMYISYLGTRFRGIQKQVPKRRTDLEDPLTIQGMLEIALKECNPANIPDVVISSRTDAGVHALRTAVHVDLKRATSTHNYDPHELIRRINKYFDKNNIAIRVQECQIVPETFHARYSAIKRSYLYRLAVRKPDAPALQRPNKELTAQIPFCDWRRCYFVQNPEFDEEKLRSAASLFPGEKDFRTFMGSSHNDKNTNNGKEKSSIRVLHSLDISLGQPSLPYYVSSSSSHYIYWNIVFCSNSFVYRQVRRIVGVLVSVAQGRIQHSDVEHMLTNPSPMSWKSCVTLAPAYGLYMLNVEYNPSDLVIENEKADDSEPGVVLIRQNQLPIG